MTKPQEKQKLQEQLFQQVLDSYNSALWRVVLTYESNQESQEELFQDILLAVWKSLQGFKGMSNVETYVYRVAHNAAFSYLQKQLKKLKTSEDGDQLVCDRSDPLAHLADNQQVALLTNAIRKLPISERQLVALSLEGLTYPQISEIVGLSTNQVGVYLTRARAKLKALLAE